MPWRKLFVLFVPKNPLLSAIKNNHSRTNSRMLSVVLFKRQRQNEQTNTHTHTYTHTKHTHTHTHTHRKLHKQTSTHKYRAKYQGEYFQNLCLTIGQHSKFVIVRLALLFFLYKTCCNFDTKFWDVTFLKF